MKKIKRSDLKGLLDFPVFSLEDMRGIVGGTDDSVQGWGFYDNLGNFMWFSSYDECYNNYTAYISNGYVDHSSPGYFYLDNGAGGYNQFYNSVYGYGANET